MLSINANCSSWRQLLFHAMAVMFLLITNERLDLTKAAITRADKIVRFWCSAAKFCRMQLQ
jgi:hypothetical protein